MKKIRYEYSIVNGANKRKVLKKENTREAAREFKRDLDKTHPEQKHRIIQRRYELAEAKEIR